MFFKRNNKLEGEVYDLKKSKSSLQDQILKLQEQRSSIELKNKMKIQDIEHMVKIKEERLEIKYDRKVVTLERKMDEDVLVIKNTYRDKVESLLETEKKELRGMYSEILKRLPDINVAIKGSV